MPSQKLRTFEKNSNSLIIRINVHTHTQQSTNMHNVVNHPSTPHCTHPSLSLPQTLYNPIPIDPYGLPSAKKFKSCFTDPNNEAFQLPLKAADIAVQTVVYLYFLIVQNPCQKVEKITCIFAVANYLPLPFYGQCLGRHGMAKIKLRDLITTEYLTDTSHECTRRCRYKIIKFKMIPNLVIPHDKHFFLQNK